MRYLAMLTALIALAVILFFAFFRGDERAPLEPRVIDAPVANDVQTMSAYAAELATSTEAAARKVAVETSASPKNAAETSATPRCRVFGRIVDEEHHPIFDVGVSLYPVGGTWSEKEKLPLLGQPGHTYESLAVRSDNDGRFQFEAPIPTADRAALDVAPSIYFSLVMFSFGPLGGRNKPRLVAGDNDLGEIVLKKSGAVEGRIRAADGTGIEKANVSARSDPVTGRIANASTDSTGHFVLGHLPEGEAPLEINADGWVPPKRASPAIRKNETQRIDDIVLEPASSISGVVVEENNAPVPNARIYGRPQSKGRSVGATSDANGAFKMFLPQTEAYTLEVRRMESFEPWGGERGAKSCTFEPGSDDVRIVLKRNLTITFRVVDDATQSPIENFGIAIEARLPPGTMRATSRSDMKIESHPGGTAVLSASPEKHIAIVSAPRHASTMIDVALDAGGGNTQTIALARASQLRGLVVRDGKPMSQANATVQRETLTKDGTPCEFEGSMGTSLHNDVDEYTGRKRNVTTDAEGRFDVDELAGGTYSLRIEGDGLAKTSWRGLVVPKESALDMGQLTLAAEARIVGRFVPASNESLIGFDIHLDSGVGGSITTDRADGSFEFRGLKAGKHLVSWSRPDPQQQSFAASESNTSEVVIAAGETREVEIHLADYLPCVVNVLVMRGNAPVRGAIVSLQVPMPDQPKAYSMHSTATTNAAGRVVLSVDGSTRFDLIVSDSNYRPISEGLHDLVAPVGGVLDRTIELHLGTIVLELPSSLAKPDGDNSLSFTALDARGRTYYGLARTAGGPPLGAAPNPWTSNVVELGEFPAGAFEVAIEIMHLTRDETRPNAWKQTPLRETFKTSIQIEDGAVTRVVVPE